MSDNEREVTIEVAGRVAVLTLDRPPVNALASSTYTAIGSALSDLAANTAVSVVVVRSSSEQAFCAGADIGELGQLSGQDAAAADGARQELARETFSQLLLLPQPTIAVVDGPAIGAGAVIASCCDLRLASPRASFQLLEVAVGRCGGARHMMRHLPQSVVRRMYFTADRISAQQAAEYGFVEVVPEGIPLFDEALAVAQRIAKHSPLALRLGKEALNSSEPLPVGDGYAVEQQYTLRLARSADAQEALQARREKREPQYTGT